MHVLKLHLCFLTITVILFVGGLIAVIGGLFGFDVTVGPFVAISCAAYLLECASQEYVVKWIVRPLFRMPPKLRIEFDPTYCGSFALHVGTDRAVLHGKRAAQAR